eukprot:2086492-Alexandrium_andersonii.AAC.1
MDLTCGMHSLVKSVLERSFRTEKHLFCMQQGHTCIKLRGNVQGVFKMHGFISSLRQEVAVDLSVQEVPEFDAVRELLAGNNGRVLDCRKGALVDMHRKMYIANTLNWPLA